jgi:nuclear receptor interaction protein
MGQIFSYDFLKAILLWLEGGPVALLKGFERASGPRATNIRFPIPEGSVQSALNEYLIPYLLGLARNRPILNVDASRFERDESRLVFETEAAAVVAFSHAIRIPLEDRFQALVPLSSAQASGRSVPLLATQDRSVALRFWGFNVGRGVLMNAGEGVTLAFVDIAFGGQGLPQDVDEGRIQEEIALNAIDEIIHPANLVRGASAEGPEQRQSSADLRQSQRTPLELNEPRSNLEPRSENTIREHSDRRMKDGDDDDDEKEAEEEEEEEEIVLMEDLQSEFSQVIHDHESSSDNEMRSETNGGDNDDGDGSDGGGGGRGDDSDDDVDNDDDDDNGSITTEERRFMWQSASKRGKLRESVGIDVPCSTHTRQYRGHCNIKTVKDVNFFGLQDEYVVSGSDSGHVFVWDKKTSQLLNILEGDGEVVNVVQGTRIQHQHIKSVKVRC